MKLPEIPFSALNGGHETALLTSKAPSFPYGQQERTVPDKWRYGIVLQGSCFTPLTITVAGSEDALPEVTEEMIAEACSELHPIFVKPIGCKIKVYTIDKETKMSATASSIELVKPSK